jgi:hypothetical protein
MADEFLEERRRALEEQFFRKQEQAILERMRAAQAQQTAREVLAQASGIQDTGVLDRLLGLGVQADTLAAMSLVPLVAVAWADGTLDEPERRAVVTALESASIMAGSPAGQLVQSWLTSAPPATLLEAWKTYTAALCRQLSAAECDSLRRSVLDRARAVAETAGGFLGLGKKTSSAEEGVLQTLGKAFAG